MSLELCQTQIGDQAASALSSALTKRTVPKLTSIRLSQNQLGDSGLSTMASALRQLPKLKRIILNGNQIGANGLATLLGEPMFQSLKYLRIGENNDEDDVTDAGRALLATIPGGSFFCCEGSVPYVRWVRRLGWRHATVLEHEGPYSRCSIWEQEFPGDCGRFF